MEYSSVSYLVAMLFPPAWTDFGVWTRAPELHDVCAADIFLFAADAELFLTTGIWRQICITVIRMARGWRNRRQLRK